MGKIRDITIAYCDRPFRSWKLQFVHELTGRKVDMPLFDKDMPINALDTTSDQGRRRAQELAVRYLDRFYPGWEE